MLNILQINQNKSKYSFIQTCETMLSENFDIVCAQEIPENDGKIISWPHLTNHKWFLSNNSINSPAINAGILINTRLGDLITLSEYTDEFTVAILIKNKTKSFIIVSSYLKSDHNINLDIKNLSNLIDNYPLLPVIVCMDSNAHSPIWFNDYLDLRGKSLENFIDSHNLFCLNIDNSIPTWESGNRHSNIDLTIVNAKALYLSTNWHIPDIESFSDHKYIALKFGKHNISTWRNQATLKTKSYKNTDWIKYEHHILSNVNFFNELSNQLTTYVEIDNYIDSLEKIILQGISLSS